MDEHWIDVAGKSLAAGRSRRHLFSSLVRGGVVGAVCLLRGPSVGAKPSCRQEGHPCEGNQTCCEGLICSPNGPGSAMRCTADVPETSCEEDCAPAEPNVVAVAAAIDVDAACAYSGEMRRTTCTFSAVAAEGTVRAITVPASMLCAEVVKGDFETVSLGANARPEAGGLRSTQAEGVSAVVTVELAGEVTTAATATYWCETDGAVLVPVTGPGLRCESLETNAEDARASTGTIIVQTYACDGTVAEADANWFQMCDAPTAETSFRLDRRDGDGWVDLDTQATDAEGLCRFSELSPGTYRLGQTDGTWCHAKSDRVDQQGNVIVEAGARSTVWVFNCIAP